MMNHYYKVAKKKMVSMYFSTSHMHAHLSSRGLCTYIPIVFFTF